MEDRAVLVLRGLEEMYPEIRFIEHLRSCIELFPDENWGDFMSRGQTRSKQWILHELRRAKITDLGRVYVCGGWYGLMSRFLLDAPDFTTDMVISVDNDSVCSTIARHLNLDHFENTKFDAQTYDMIGEVPYTMADTIINTSCEHLSPGDFSRWSEGLPSGKLIILQSNDFRKVIDHLGCVDSAEELYQNTGLSELIYTGQMPLYGYTRFMVIGRT